jgi:hypothetical protein
MSLEKIGPNILNARSQFVLFWFLNQLKYISSNHNVTNNKSDKKESPASAASTPPTFRIVFRHFSSCFLQAIRAGVRAGECYCRTLVREASGVPWIVVCSDHSITHGCDINRWSCSHSYIAIIHLLLVSQYTGVVWSVYTWVRHITGVTIHWCGMECVYLGKAHYWCHNTLVWYGVCILG